MHPYRVVRYVHGGQHYHPVVDATGRILTLPEAEELAERPFRPASERRLRVVLFDESRFRNGDPRRCIDGYRWLPGMPLTYADLWLPIGAFEEVKRVAPGTVPGTEGAALVAVARMDATILADVAWSAVRRGLFTGVCCVVADQLQDVVTGQVVEGEIKYTILGDSESVCCPNARVVGAWEGSRP